LRASHVWGSDALASQGYGSTLEIGHIVSLELGGSNEVANLYPEKATLPGGMAGLPRQGETREQSVAPQTPREALAERRRRR
jgi:hypothetical protein